MTAQHHINAIGESLLDVEEATEDVRRAARRLKRALDVHHRALEVAQTTYCKTYPSDNVVAFSGGTNKPPVDDPDEPVDPVP